MIIFHSFSQEQGPVSMLRLKRLLSTMKMQVAMIVTMKGVPVSLVYDQQSQQNYYSYDNANCGHYVWRRCEATRTTIVTFGSSVTSAIWKNTTAKYSSHDSVTIVSYPFINSLKHFFIRTCSES